MGSLPLPYVLDGHSSLFVFLAETRRWRYFADVISLRCPKCGAELMPEGRFCRQCGEPATNSSEATDSSELPTEMLDHKANLTTSRLKPRTTSPENPRPGLMGEFGTEIDAAAQTKRRRFILIGSAILVLLVCGIIASIAYVRGISSRTTDDAILFYPGARTIVDMVSDDGRTIQLQTNDPLDKVIAWYENSIKPTKTMRLTSTNVVLKNQKVTTTLATEGGKTNILIKKLR